MKKLIIFDSIHYTIKADKLLQKTDYEYQIISTPNEINNDCGMCLETNEDELKNIQEYLINNEINFRVFDRE